MGTYLSTPVTEKSTEEGFDLICETTPVAWGVVDMQGWRKSMEDAHVATAGIPVPRHLLLSDQTSNEAKAKAKAKAKATTRTTTATTTAKVFAVFDGHGGPEVARFCALYLVSVLTQQETWKNSQPKIPPCSSPHFSDIGKAIKATFHALDRMIDHPARRDELMRLRAVKPVAGEAREAKDIPLPRVNIIPGQTQPTATFTLEEDDLPFDEQNTTKATTKNIKMVLDTSSIDNFIVEKKDDDSEAVVGLEEACKLDRNLSSDTNSDFSGDSDSSNSHYSSDNSSLGNVAEEEEEQEDKKQQKEDNGHGINNSHDENMPTQTHQQRPQEQDDGESGHADTEDDEPRPPNNKIAANKSQGKLIQPNVSSMFSRLLHMSVASAEQSKRIQGQLIVSTSVHAGADAVDLDPDQHAPPTIATTAAPASILQSGRRVCNLPDHAVHAGATAVCAILIGNQLTVANAGDSRAVLCRSGAAFPLSFDHKPNHDAEMSRITQAGGFVNHFGRVNGNLNLSRSIGDLKYKQVAGLSPAKQIITAEPDLVQIHVDTTIDQFIILACDGIWDCLTNQQAVDYVANRIETQKPAEIGAAMLDDIISTNPRNTAGIGGDNMTVLIIDLQPRSRSYYRDKLQIHNNKVLEVEPDHDDDDDDDSVPPPPPPPEEKDEEQPQGKDDDADANDVVFALSASL